MELAVELAMIDTFYFYGSLICPLSASSLPFICLLCSSYSAGADTVPHINFVHVYVQPSQSADPGCNTTPCKGAKQAVH